MENNRFRDFSRIVLVLNVLTLIFGMTYIFITYFLSPVNSPIWNFFGVVMIITWILSLGLVFWTDKFFENTDYENSASEKYSDYLPIGYILAMFFFIGNNLIHSFTLGRGGWEVLAIILSIAGLGIVCFFGIVLPCENLKMFRREV